MEHHPPTSRVDPISDKVSRPLPALAGVLRKFIPPVATKGNTPPPPYPGLIQFPVTGFLNQVPPQKNIPKKRISRVAASPPPLEVVDETFKVKIGNKTFTIAIDISYDEFDNDIESHMIVEDGEIRVYRANTGTMRDRKWKPIQFPSELTTLIKKYADVGVELTVQKQVK